jgi:hypothetical protein
MLNASSLHYRATSQLLSTVVGVEKVGEQKSFLSYECHCQFFFSMFG